MPIAGALFADRHDKWVIARRYFSEAPIAILSTRISDDGVTAELEPDN